MSPSMKGQIQDTSMASEIPHDVPLLSGRIRPRQETAIENQGLARHKGCTVGAHPHDSFGDFRRSSKTADRMEAKSKLVHLRLAKNTVRHRRFDHRRAHNVDTNPVSSVFERGRL